LLVRIKRILTPEQQAQLRQVRAERVARAKWKRIQQLAGRWELEGRDVSIFRRLERELRPLWDSGKFIEAEAAIDRVLKQLQSDANE